MAALTFDKYEGLGNDFIVVDARDERAVSSEQAQVLCDRHFGIGADGVILVTPSETARARMIVLNADGSRPEMCGNGLRCVALHLTIADGANGASFVVDTDAGPRSCEVSREDDAADVATSMGRGEMQGELRHAFGGNEYVLTRVSMGNPHAVVFGAPSDPETVDRFGPDVSRSVPGGLNVEVVTERGPRAFDVVVWERGVGRTLACGTGAAASAVAAVSSGRGPFDEPLEVRLPGGMLEVTVARDTLDVRIRGPARRVFSGEVRGP